VDALARLVVGHRVPDFHRAIVEDRRAAAGQAQRRLEAVLSGRPDGGLVPRGDSIALRERDRGARPRNPERLR
jgi:hypothetical protein